MADLGSHTNSYTVGHASRKRRFPTGLFPDLILLEILLIVSRMDLPCIVL